MAKILTDKELGEIIHRAINDESVIDDADSYEHFLEDLTDLICTHFGGIRGNVEQPDFSLPWTVSVRFNDCVPSDGGIYKDLDKDVTWENGIET